MRKVCTLFLTVLIFFISCGKEESFEIARSKSGDFKMKADDVEWKAEKDINVAYGQGIFVIQGTGKNGFKLSIMIQNPKLGEIEIGRGSEGNLVLYSNTSNISDNYQTRPPGWVSDEVDGYILKVKITELDIEKKIVSGTFEGQLIHSTSDKVI